MTRSAGVGFAACFLLLAGATSASAKPPAGHGKEATKWSRTDTPRTFNGTAGPDVFVTGAGDDTINGKKAVT